MRKKEKIINDAKKDADMAKSRLKIRNRNKGKR